MNQSMNTTKCSAQKQESREKPYTGNAPKDVTRVRSSKDTYESIIRMMGGQRDFHNYLITLFLSQLPVRQPSDIYKI